MASTGTAPAWVKTLQNATASQPKSAGQVTDAANCLYWIAIPAFFNSILAVLGGNFLL